MLHSRRLVLRPLTEADVPALLEAAEESRELLRKRLAWAGAALSPQSEAAFVSAARALDPELGGRWGVFEASSGALAGVVSLVTESVPGCARLGCWIRARRQEKGLATEAGRLALDEGFRKLGLHRVYTRLDPSNRAFRKVLKKLGFKYEGCLRAAVRLNGRWIDQECWGLLGAEWKK